MRRSWNGSKFLAPLGVLLAALLVMASTCGQKPPPAPPVTKVPSQVITDQGMKFFVWGLKLPGTSQELKLKKGGATTWIPLSIIQVITFNGPVEERFRPAQIFLTSGEGLTGELFVDQLIEGTTDLGYWNMPLQDIRQIGMGVE